MHRGLFAVKITYNTGQNGQTGHFCGAQPALPCNNLVFAVVPAHKQRLQNAHLPDAERKLLDIPLVKLPARCPGSGRSRFTGICLML